MKNSLLLVVIFFSTNSTNAQDSTLIFKNDSALYIYALNKYLTVYSVTDTVWLEGNSAFDLYVPKSVANLKINLIYPIDYIEYIKKKRLQKVILMQPLSIEGNKFSISISSFNIYYIKKKRLLKMVNTGGITLYYQYNCQNGGFLLVNELYGH